MGSSGRGLPPRTGLMALLSAVGLLGVGAALLVGPSTALVAGATGTFSGVSVSLPTSTWALLFLLPVTVGTTVYALGRFASARAHGTTFLTFMTDPSPAPREAAASTGASGASFAETGPRGALPGAPPRPARAAIALILVAVLLTVGVVLETTWNGSSLVTVDRSGSRGPGATGSDGGNNPGSHGGSGTNGSSGAGNGTGSGSGAGNGTGTGTGNGTGGRNDTGNDTGNGSGNFTGPGNSCGRAICRPNGTGPGGGGSRGNNTTGVSRGASPTRGVAYVVPNWVFVLTALGLSAVIGVLAMPGMLSRLVDGRPGRGPTRPPPADPSAWTTVFREARLSVESGERPRDAIIRLYGALIGRVTANPAELASATAREIMQTRLLTLRVPAASAEAVTQMFEEARYSTHPVGEATAARFVETMRAIEHALLGFRAAQ